MHCIQHNISSCIHELSHYHSTLFHSLLSFSFHFPAELTLSESDDPPNPAERIATINNQHYQFHSDYDNENSFTSDNDNHDDISLQNALNRGPYFDLTASKNVTALVGNTAYLNCRVRNLGNKTVTNRFEHFSPSIYSPIFHSISNPRPHSPPELTQTDYTPTLNMDELCVFEKSEISSTLFSSSFNAPFSTFLFYRHFTSTTLCRPIPIISSTRLT